MNYLTSFICQKQLWIVMPLYGFTSASRLIVSEFKDGLSEYALALIVRDVLQGLQYIHSRGIIHRYETIFDRSTADLRILST